MSIAYTIRGAAEAAAVTEAHIIAAVKAKHLTARQVDEKRAVILATDIQAWIETLPSLH